LGARDYVAKGFEAGADDYIVKPVNSDELRSRVAVGERIIAVENHLYQETQRLEQIVEERARLLVHADRMATVGTLAAGVAHEINNPATFVAGNIKVLEQCISIMEEHLPDAGDDEDERLSLARRELPKIFTSMRKGISRIENIVSALLAYSRKSRGDVHSAVDMEECIEDALQLCHNKVKYNINVERKKLEAPVFVQGNEQQLVQVLVNLIVNAADAMKTKKNATLTIETLSRPSTVTVSVSDSGSGIQEDMLDKIYDPFFSTKEEKGTGLGLSISKNIIETHRGGIRAENRPEGGARFIVTLPRMHCEQRIGGVDEA
jgi:C4-dicarboxylate-specific signal transduction histidine kinase